MEYNNNYCFPSSSSKKLMIVITTILLLIVTVAATNDAETSRCGLKKPVSYGPCKKNNSCVTSLLTYLRDKTPYDQDYKFAASHPNPYKSGGYKGLATCEYQSSQADCQSCLDGAQNWLITNCVSYSLSSGYYTYGICSMSFQQIIH
ncbi:hypothetical protein LINGRAHAP2_LOCUS34007 [Linum grandiflorum]